jgi:hypothetical protein
MVELNCSLRYVGWLEDKHQAPGVLIKTYVSMWLFVT